MRAHAIASLRNWIVAGSLVAGSSYFIFSEGAPAVREPGRVAPRAPAPPRWEVPRDLEHAERLSVPIRPEDPSLGPLSAAVTIVEYSDFRCGGCRIGANVIHGLLAKYGSEVRLVFKPYAINSPLAAEAALAAHEQGGFWAMHDRLFAYEGPVTRESMVAHARSLGLDADRFRATLDTARYRTRVDDELREGEKLGVDRTPTFFVNGIRVPGALSFDDFDSLLKRELDRQQRKISRH